MLHNLRAEMARRGIKNSDIANAISVSDKTARNKISGRSDFTFPEAEAIRDTFFTDKDLEYLLEKDNQ